MQQAGLRAGIRVDLKRVHDIAIRRVDLVEEGSFFDRHFLRDFADLERGIECHRAVRLHGNHRNGKRLKAILPGLISALERNGHLAVDPIVRQHLLAVSPATIDRLLAPIRGTAGRRRKRKPATKSSRQIPIRTFADWKEPEPGFLEVDFVAHCGDSMQGTFLWSLVATDVCSGWTEAVPLVAREQFLVIEGLAVMRRQFPVPIRGIDTDNDSAFINETLQG